MLGRGGQKGFIVKDFHLSGIAGVFMGQNAYSYFRGYICGPSSDEACYSCCKHCGCTTHRALYCLHGFFGGFCARYAKK